MPQQQRAVASAGVLCFSSRTDGKTVILLGREKETIGWKQGSNKWSSFSGRMEQGENVFDGAAREFVEESLAVVPLAPEEEEATTAVPSRVRAVLENNGNQVELYMRVSPPLMHVSFVQRVEYADYPSRFKSLRASLNECDTRFRAYHRAKKTAEALPKLLFPGYRLSPSLTVVSGARVSKRGVLLKIWDSVTERLVQHEVALTHAMAREAADIYDMWDEVLEHLERNASAPVMQHPAMCLQRAGPHVVGAYVNRCYLEKSEIKWWGIEELENASRTRPQDFRRFFGGALPDLIAAVKAAVAQEKHEPPEKKNRQDCKEAAAPCAKACAASAPDDTARRLPRGAAASAPLSCSV